MSDQNVTILVVDDNPATLYSTSRVLRGAGWNVLTAASGNEALELAGECVDVVVLDVNMPDIDGLEVCRRLRQAEVTARLPVIHLSATFVDDMSKVQGLESGADGYLTHPVEPLVLVATVNAFLRTRQAEQELRRSEAKFKAVFENALNGISLLDGELVHLEINPAWCRILQRPAETIAGQSLLSYVSSGQEQLKQKLDAQLREKGTWRDVVTFLRGDGQLVHLDCSISHHSVPRVWLAMVSDVTQRLHFEREREELLVSERAARADAERANRLKDDFLATLSHELRTPLSSIVGWSQLLKMGKLDAAETDEAINAVERNANALAKMISDLLDVSRITSGKLRLDVQSLFPAGLIEEALAAVSPAAAAKSIRVVKNLDPHAGPVSGDPSRLQQVVWNLVNNAVKFTPPSGRINVTLRQLDAHVEIVVTDTGRGFDASLKSGIFERFRQGDASTTREHGGLGLGLAIAKQLVEMHGGYIEAESPGLGMGATFTVTLPVLGASSFRTTDEQLADTLPAVSASFPESISLDGVRVLLVDDDPDTRNLLARIVDATGAEIKTAGNVTHALAAIDEFKPHVLVSDLGMPGQDGFDLIRQVRERGLSLEQLPAVALTAFARQEDRRRVLLAGFQMHVAKPVDPGELNTVIATLVGRSAGA